MGIVDRFYNTRYRARTGALLLKNRAPLSKSRKLKADFPKHPDSTIINKNEFYPSGLDEEAIWAYYDHVAEDLVPQLTGGPVLIVTATNGDTTVRWNDPKTKEPIEISSVTDFDNFNNGRNVEFHRTMGETTDRIWVDLDPQEDFSWEDCKSVAEQVAELLKDFPKVDKTEIRFSGGRGLHVYGWLRGRINIDAARNDLKEVLEQELVPQDSRLTTGLVKKSDMMRLDVTTLHKAGSLRAMWSLNVNTGLVCMDVDQMGKAFDVLQRSDFVIDAFI